MLSMLFYFKLFFFTFPYYFGLRDLYQHKTNLTCIDKNESLDFDYC